MGMGSDGGGSGSIDGGRAAPCILGRHLSRVDKRISEQDEVRGVPVSHNEDSQSSWRT